MRTHGVRRRTGRGSALGVAVRRPATSKPAYGAVLAAVASLLAGPAAVSGQVARAPHFALPVETHAAPPIAATTTRGPAALPIATMQGLAAVPVAAATPGLATVPVAAATPGLATVPVAGSRGWKAAPASADLHVLRQRAPPDAWFAEDKARHLFASLALTAVVFGGATAVGLEWPDAGIAAGAVAGAAGLAKELSDRARGRPFSVRDLVWDGAGVGAGLVLAERARR